MHLLLSLLLCAASAAATPSLKEGDAKFISNSPLTITLTPWCANSFRVQVSTTAFPAATAAGAALRATLASHGLQDLPGALLNDCGPGAAVAPAAGGAPVRSGALGAALAADGHTLRFFNAATGAPLLAASVALGPGGFAPYLAASVQAVAGNASERFFGLGQTNWTDMDDNGCPVGAQRVVPLQRNGQTVRLQHTKFHVAIPFVFSTAGYGFLFNMPGQGSAAMGAFGTGGMQWVAEAALALDFWVTCGEAPAVYSQYADATGHAPLLRADAQLFWQSRLRYKSSDIALAVAQRYAELQLPVGVLVVDFYNQRNDGDFAVNPDCFPSLPALTSGLRARLNATTMFSFWPEVAPNSTNLALFTAAGCLANADLGGRVLDTTIPACRALLWERFLLPNYYAQGVNAFWVDEDDSEGTAGGDGNYGYNTSFGPPWAFSQLWVGSWLSTFASPVAALGEVTPLMLTRGVWAGGQRYGAVLWSSDIDSTFETLAAQVPLGTHASMSGIAWWTSDVGGFGCSRSGMWPSNSSYMQELIVRWYQFGLFCVRR
jgi:alpha-D-xyloside xylohydrolase